MPIIDPASIQHVLQMSSAVERVVVETQAHHAVDQTRMEERLHLDQLEQNEVQDPKEAEESNPSDPDGKASNRQVRIMKKKETAETEEEAPETRLHVVEEDPGSKLDIRI